MRGIRILRIFARHLEAIRLPPLARPYDTPQTPKSEEIVQWGICMYVYSVTSHLRMIVRGLLTLAEDGNTPATAPIARHVFEWTAAACYLTEDLRERFENQNWEAAWETLTSFTLGSGWVKKWGKMYGPFDIEPNDGVQVPPGPGKLVASYERYFVKENRGRSALEEYSHLCDHSHTTSVALTRYQRNPTSPNVNVTMFGLDLQKEQLASFLGCANVSLIDAFSFFYTLLGLSGEKSLQPAVLATLKEIAECNEQNDPLA